MLLSVAETLPCRRVSPGKWSGHGEETLCVGDPLCCYDRYPRYSLTVNNATYHTVLSDILRKVTKNNLGAGNITGSSKIRWDRRHGQQRWERCGNQTCERGGCRLPPESKVWSATEAFASESFPNAGGLHRNTDFWSDLHCITSFTDAPFLFCIFKLCSYQDNSTMLSLIFWIKDLILVQKDLVFLSIYMILWFVPPHLQ